MMENSIKGTVLIIDDDPASLGLLFDYLERSGFKVLIAEKGSSAIRIMKQIRPDIILLDIRLPDTDGFDLCEKIAAYHGEIPIIFVSALTGSADRIRGLKLSAADYISKPFDPEELVIRVEKQLEFMHLKRDLEEKNLRLKQEIRLREDTEIRLREREEQYRQIVELSPDLIAVHQDRKFVFINEQGAKMLGLSSPEEILGKDILDYISPEIRKDAGQRVRRLLQEQKKSPLYETCLLRTDGGKTEAEVMGLPCIYKNRAAVQVIARDISKRKQAEKEQAESRKTLEAILSASPVGVGMVKKRILNWSNEAMHRLLGYSSEELMGRSASMLYEDREEFERVGRILYREILENGFGQIETRWKRKDDTVFDCFLQVRPLDPTNHSLGQITAAMDISERKQYENALKQARDEAETANRAKSAFLASMSHELRTPLNIILGYNQVLQHYEYEDPEIAEHLETMSKTGFHLLTLINDLLDISRIGSEKMELKVREIYFPGFLKQLTSAIRIQAEEKGLIFRFEPDSPLPFMIEADEIRLRQVLLHLLGNAVKFTERGTVTFRVTDCGPRTELSEDKKETRIRFDIRDTGKGIDADHLKTVFQVFEQDGNTEQWQPGIGIGLAISSYIVQLMGGEINVSSEPGKGSRFSFEVAVAFFSAYENETRQIPEENGTDQETIIPPPKKDLLELRRLAKLGIMKGIEQSANELEQRDICYTPFADCLKKHAFHFDHEKIIEFIDGYLFNNDDNE